MKILFISSKSPFPPKDGHCLRTYNLLKQASKSHEIYFLTFFLEKEETVGRNFDEVKKLCEFSCGFEIPINKSKILFFLTLIKSLFSSLPFVCLKYNTKEMTHEIKKILLEGKIDVVHVDILALMHYFQLFKGIPVVFVNHNVESLLLLRQLKFTKNILVKFFLYLQYKKTYSFESARISEANCCIAVSDQDKKVLNKMNPMAQLKVVANGVDLDFFYPCKKEFDTDLVFVGGLNWFPNYDGVSYFCESVLPNLIKKIGKIKTVIIGKENKNFKYRDMVSQVGSVEDIRPYIHKAKVYIVPLRIGGGTRLKILDAMAMGKAIVSTSIGCEGLEVEDGKHLMILDGPEELCNNIIDLLNNDEKREFLGKNARKLVEDKYSWEYLGAQMEAVYSSMRRK